MKIVSKRLVWALAVFLVTIGVCVFLFAEEQVKNTAFAPEKEKVELMSDEAWAKSSSNTLNDYGNTVRMWDISATESDSVTAKLYNKDEVYTLVIYGSGDMQDWSSSSTAPWYSLCDIIHSVIIEDDVIAIGKYALYGCTNLTNVIIGNGVKSIGTSAFSYCTSLTSVTIPDSVETLRSYAFAYCSQLSNLVLGSSLTNIMYNAFESCTSLTSVTIPASVTKIGSSAFQYCRSLNAVYITDIAAWCNISFNNYSANPLHCAKNLYLNGRIVTDLIIPEGVTTINNYTFYYCTNLTRITIPDSVTSIGPYTFYACTNLQYNNEYDNAYYLGSNANPYLVLMKAKDTSIASVSIHNDTKFIHSYAFSYCENLVQVTIPYSGTSIGDQAFLNCTNLMNVTIPNSVTYIGSYAFAHCTNLKSITIPDGLTSIYRHTFSNCTSLTNVVIGNSVKSIGEYAFGGCTSLTIYCEGESQPEGWHTSWNHSNRPVVWGYKALNISTNLTLGSDLSVNAYVNYSETDGEGVIARFTMNERTVEVPGTWVASLEMWKFTFTGVTPINMGDLIQIKLIIDGEIVASLEDYSVKKYCTNLLGMTKYELGLSDAKYAAIRTLVCDLLDYGAAAQKYMDYKTDELVNDGIEGASEFVPVTETDMKLTNLTNIDGVKFKSANLRFNNANQIRFKFTAPDISLVTLRIVIGARVRDYTAKDFILEDGVYSIYTEDIYATSFDDIYYAVIIYDGVEVQTAAYSVRSYTYSKQNSTDTTLAELVRATYKYGKSAKVYANTN